MTMTTTTRALFSRRWFIDLLLILCAFSAPWWLTLLVASLFFFVFDRFWELLLLSLLIDLLYGTSRAYFFNVTFVLSFCAVPLYIFLTLIRHRMRF